MFSISARIKKLVPPPSRPVGLHRDWQEVEDGIGLSLPSDYKDFVDTYGTGLIVSEGMTTGCLSVWNFRHQSPNVSLTQPITDVIAEYENAEGEGNDLSFDLYPAPGGLLPFASTQNGDYFNWNTSVKGRWNVVFYLSSRAEMVPLRRKTFSRVLADLLEGNSPLINKPINSKCFRPPYHFAEFNW